MFYLISWIRRNVDCVSSASTASPVDHFILQIDGRWWIDNGVRAAVSTFTAGCCHGRRRRIGSVFGVICGRCMPSFRRVSLAGASTAGWMVWLVATRLGGWIVRSAFHAGEIGWCGCFASGRIAGIDAELEGTWRDWRWGFVDRFFEVKLCGFLNEFEII